MDLFDLKGRVALVTGGNGGIGLGMALGLAQAGAALAVAGRNARKSEAAVKQIAALGVEAAFIEVDVLKTELCKAMVAETVKRFGRLDILVNNAGTTVAQAPGSADRRRLAPCDRYQPHQRLSLLARGLSRDEEVGAAARSSISAR